MSTSLSVATRTTTAATTTAATTTAPTTTASQLRCAAGSWWARRHWHPRAWLRGAPVTTAYLVALTATTLTLSGAHPRVAHWMMTDASTNLHNMTSQPMRALVTSAFWLESPWLIWPMAALLVVVMAPAERALGGVRTVVAFTVGHVGATVITVIAIAGGIAAGVLPHSLARAVDIGPSYGLAALGAVLIVRLPHRRSRLLLAGLLIACLATAAVVSDDFTDAGHLAAAVLGLLVAIPLLRARRRLGSVGRA